MKKNNRYPNTNVSKALLTLLTLFILIIACSKEHTTPVNSTTATTSSPSQRLPCYGTGQLIF